MNRLAGPAVIAFLVFPLISGGLYHFYEVNPLHSKFNELQAEVAALPRDVFDPTPLNKRLDDFQAEVAALPRDVFDPTRLNKRLDDLQAEVAALPRDVFDPTPLNKRLDDLQAEVAALPRDVFDPTRLNKRLDDLQAEVVEQPRDAFDPTPLNKRLDDLQAEVAALPRDSLDPAPLNKRLDDLQAEVAAISRARENPSKVLNFTQVNPENFKLLGEIYFEHGSFDLNIKAKNSISNLQKFNKYNHIIVVGQTDTIGSKERNLIISFLRAAKVKEYIEESMNRPHGFVISTGTGEFAAPVRTDDDVSEPLNRVVRIYGQIE